MRTLQDYSDQELLGLIDRVAADAIALSKAMSGVQYSMLLLREEVERRYRERQATPGKIQDALSKIIAEAKHDDDR